MPLQRLQEQKKCDDQLFKLLDSVGRMVSSLQFGKLFFHRQESKASLQEMLQMICDVSSFARKYIDICFISEY